jgi:hypothetical protein
MTATHGNPAFAPAQRPPVGDFPGRGGGHPSSFGQNASIFGQGGYYGAQQGSLLPPPPPSDPNASAEQRAIEAARYELELLEARKQRKRTMSSEGLPPSSEPTHPGGNNAGGAYQGSQQSGYGGQQSSYGSQQSHERDFGGPNYAFNNANNSSNSRMPPPRVREDPFGGMAGHPASGPAGYGTGGHVEAPRIAHRTRGPAEDHPHDYPDRYGYDAPQASHSAEPMWERAKRPVAEPPAVQRPQGAPGFSASNPFLPPEFSGSGGDRWGTRQQLPPPPALHMNAHYMGLQNPSTGGMRQERERGPRTGLTPREQQEQHNPGFRVPADDRRGTASPTVDPSRPFSSLFGREAGRGVPAGEHVPPREDYPPPSQHQPEQSRLPQHQTGFQQQQQLQHQHHPAQQAPRQPNFVYGQEQAHRQYAQHAPVYDADQRALPPQSSPTGTGANRPKMLFDPQSNSLRELAEREPAKPAHHARPNQAAPQRAEMERHHQKPAPSMEETAEGPRKIMQVNRIEQNTGDKWSRQSMPRDAAARQSEGGTEAAHPSFPAPSSAHIAAGDAEHNEDEHDQRHEYVEARKAARDKERAERGPRTKGYLFHYTEDGQIERLFTPEEKIRADALKARKAEKAERERRQAAEDGNPLAVVSIDNLPLRLTTEQFKALTLDQRQELKAKQAEARAAREARNANPAHSAHAASTAAPAHPQDARTAAHVAPVPVSVPVDSALKLTEEEYRALTSEQKRELRARQQDAKIARRTAQIAAKRERQASASASAGAETEPDQHASSAPTNVRSVSADDGELDIQKMALQADAGRAKRRDVPAFIPGQGYSGAAAHEEDQWQRGSAQAAHSNASYPHHAQSQPQPHAQQQPHYQQPLQMHGESWDAQPYHAGGRSAFAYQTEPGNEW